MPISDPHVRISAISDADPRSADLRSFVKYFKRYMGVMPVFTAAVAPIITAARAIPVYKQEAYALSAYSGVLGFLLISWVFYIRKALARFYFGAGPDISRRKKIVVGLLPLAFILLSLLCFFQYFRVLKDSVNTVRISDIRSRCTQQGIRPLAPQESLDNYVSSIARFCTVQPIDRSSALAQETMFVPDEATLMWNYLGIFVWAEIAFIVMALREFLEEQRPLIVAGSETVRRS